MPEREQQKRHQQGRDKSKKGFSVRLSICNQDLQLQKTRQAPEAQKGTIQSLEQATLDGNRKFTGLGVLEKEDKEGSEGGHALEKGESRTPCRDTLPSSPAGQGEQRSPGGGAQAAKESLHSIPHSI